MAEDMTKRIQRIMPNQENIRNIAIAAHIDHGKTTFSDNLLLGAGMMSEETAGKARALDFHEDEATRGITIDAAAVSMVHLVGGKEFLINLIDTPGHVDFGGDVTRAMRAVDGAIVLSCAVEGVMPQTETVLRQALKERVKPILFINKVDRLIKEVKLTPEAMQEKFVSIINKVNELIQSIAPEEYKKGWRVQVNDGSVCFGSAFHNWGLSVPYMQKKGISFKEIIDAYSSGNAEDYKKLAKKAPVHEVVLDAVVKHLPNPVVAQKYRIPKIWNGDLDSEIGKSLLTCDPKGEIAFVPTKIVVDKSAGEVAAGRLFSGTLEQGQEVYMNVSKLPGKIQQLSVYKGAQRMVVDKVCAGNIIGVVGLKGIYVGETVSQHHMEPFEAITHLFEPVVTKSIEPLKAADLPKMIDILKQVAKEDPSIRIEINEDTGESLMSGMGELHLEIIENRIKTEKGLNVKTSAPIIVYNETVAKASEPCEGRSPNKHNGFFLKVEPLDDKIYAAIKSGTIKEGRIKKNEKTLIQALTELGVANDEAKEYRDVYKGSVLLDKTKGEVHIGEVIEMVIDAFEQVMNACPLAREPGTKMKISLADIKLHEDAIHRGPAQVYPAVRDAISEAMKKAGTSLFEPIQTHLIECPSEFMGEITKLVAGKRGQLISVEQEGGSVELKAKIPVSEMIGWSSDLRGCSEGRGVSSLIDQHFEKMPRELQDNVVRKIRERKGLSENQ